MGRLLLILIFEIISGSTSSLVLPKPPGLFSATEISRLASIFYEFCPSQRCGNTTTEPGGGVPDLRMSTCCFPQCSCDPLSCWDGYYGPNCCPDLLNEVYGHPSCVNTQLKPWKPHQPIPYAYHMESKCDSRLDTGEEVADKCEFSNRFDDLDTKIPVMDDSFLQTYANLYCAKCASINNAVTWTPKIDCFKGTFEVSPIETMVERVRMSENCILYFEPPSEFYESSYLPCGKYISECNMTGNWKTYDPVLELGCRTMHAPFQNTYKNVFCYFCNSDGSAEDMPACMMPTFKQPSLSLELTYPITYNRSQIDIDASTCGPYAMYDPFQESCLEIKCLLYKIYADDGQCQRTVERISRSYQNLLLFLKFTPQGDVPADPPVINQSIARIVDYMDSFNMATPDVPLIRIAAGQRKRTETDGIDSDSKIDFLTVSFVIQMLPLHSSSGMIKISSIETLLKYHKSNLSLDGLETEDEITFLMELDTIDAAIESDDIQLNSENELETVDFEHLKNSGMETLLPVHDCPLVELDLSIYNLKNGRLSVINETFSIPVGRNEYLATKNETSILICIHIYETLIAESVLVQLSSLGSAPDIFYLSAYSLAFVLAIQIFVS